MDNNDKLIEYIYILEKMNGLLAEELSKHVNYVNKEIRETDKILKKLSEQLKDIL